MKKFLLLVLITIVSSQTGCSMWKTSFNNDDHINPYVGADNQDSTDSESINDDETDDDDWSTVGKEARGRKTLGSNPEKVSWIDKYFIHDTTRQIERNLGVY
jgi:uncharacterized protein YxeA